MKNYPTGLISNDYWASPQPPYQGEGWRILLRERLHPQAEDIRSEYKARRLPKKIKGPLTIGRELIIQASTAEHAHSAALLLHASLCLVEGQLVVLFPEMQSRREAPANLTELIAKEAREGYRPVYAEHILLRKDRDVLLSMPGFVVAAQLAALSSKKVDLQYALLKYYLSVYLVSVDSRDLNQRFGRHDVRTSPMRVDHVWFAQSIALAYGVIEELGLNVRASDKKPSTIDGQWNPEVKSDLVARLARTGIQNAERPITLCFRGQVTELERKKRPLRIAPTTWFSKRRRNRDVAVPYIDAINWLSRLRSDVSAHKLSKLSFHLTMVDAFNAQTIARRALLAFAGFWDEKRNEIRNSPLLTMIE